MNEQQRLLNAIWLEESSASIEADFELDGLNIYRRNLQANAKRALTISFPTVFSLIDSDVGENLTASFLRKSAPNQGDWSQWGDNFPAFLSATQVGEDYPYITDCALVDWHVHCALHGKDQSLEQASLQHLSDTDPEHIFIEFNQNVKLLSTGYPITDIYHAHHHEDELQRNLAMNDAKDALLSEPVNQFVMIYRPEFKPKVKNITVSEYRFMAQLLSGKSLADSLDIMRSDASFSFEKWLIKAIEDNVIYYFKEK